MNNENSTFFSHLSLSMVEHNVRAVYDWNFKLLSVGTELVYFKCNFHQCTLHIQSKPINSCWQFFAGNFLLSWFWKETKKSKMGSNNAWFVQFWIIKQLDWKNNRSQKNANEYFNLYLSCMHLWFIRNCKPTQWIFGFGLVFLF